MAGTPTAVTVAASSSLAGIEYQTENRQTDRRRNGNPSAPEPTFSLPLSTEQRVRQIFN